MAAEEEMEIMSSDEEEEQLTPEQEAEAKKEQGNAFYKQKEYHKAKDLYTQAIDLCPNCAAYWGNRAATQIMLYRYKDALSDARRALVLDSKFVKGHLREGKCHLLLGEAAASIRSYQAALQLEPKNKTAKTELLCAETVARLTEEAEKDYTKRDFRRVIFCMDRCLEHSSACHKFKIMKAESLALLGRYQEAQELANEIVQSDRMNPDAVYVRGMCLYYQDSVDKAFQHFQQVLRLAPDHAPAKQIYKKAKSLLAKKEEGNTAYKANKLETAYLLYTEALAIDPDNKFTNSKLYNNRATVCAKLGKTEQAIEDCDKAIELDDNYLKAYMRRAKCYLDSEQYEEAVRDYEKIYKLDKSRENKKCLQDAKLELKKSKRKDYYKILGINKNVADSDIKKAYKKRALIHHPDRHSHDTPEVQKEEEKKFKELGEAYSILSDPKKKARYDSGQDLEEMEGGFGADIDPNLIFQSFFGGGGGGNHFSFGGGPGFHSGGGGGGGGFPGGFSFQFG
ncbi:unnamed protein product [Owenia fusiformis]|uniref:DnaJ homolog subfamily C member 7 n=1 Tax=Owenia fusiformis TaxID=6347 RepID=A0A8J1UGA3_OWEFU|nr:unnamed protein product [Owenia fusiformis]